MNQPITLLTVQNLNVKRGGCTVLEVPSLCVEKGEILSLIGPNGSGKTTLLLSLALLLKDQQGTLSFQGATIVSGQSASLYRRSTSMVFQDPLLFDATVFDNVASGLKIRGMKKHAIKAVVHEYLEKFHIAPLAWRSARKLSGGEAQRTSLARSFATKPSLIFLDEPFSSLDPPTREALTEDLHNIIKETGTTAVMATHDLEEALRLSDRMSVMHQGKIIQIGPTTEVINAPADEFVASFVGVEAVLRGTVTKSDRGTISVLVGGHHIDAVGDALPGEAVLLCVRPENVIIAKSSSSRDSSARNRFAARVVKIVSKGLFYKVNLDCGFFLSAFVTSQSLEELSLQEGMTVSAAFKATAVHVIRT
jgi:tungstate transport system ATP-binding protein